jgi:hypothetical protein
MPPVRVTTRFLSFPSIIVVIIQSRSSDRRESRDPCTETAVSNRVRNISVCSSRIRSRYCARGRSIRSRQRSPFVLGKINNNHFPFLAQRVHTAGQDASSDMNLFGRPGTPPYQSFRREPFPRRATRCAVSLFPSGSDSALLEFRFFLPSQSRVRTPPHVQYVFSIAIYFLPLRTSNAPGTKRLWNIFFDKSRGENHHFAHIANVYRYDL